ncbi:phage tail fiber protein [Escherichia coli DEC14C]|nr:phage tail fiber protein [Escherichia coli DEC14C]
MWRHTVNRVILDATHQNRIIAELLIPPEGRILDPGNWCV